MAITNFIINSPFFKIYVSILGFKTYWKIVQPLIVELKAYKTVLKNNPSCLMVQDVSNRYIELLNQSASKLEKITNDANFAKNEHEEDTIANSNICLFVHIIKLIRESAKNWKKGPNHFLY